MAGVGCSSVRGVLRPAARSGCFCLLVTITGMLVAANPLHAQPIHTEPLGVYGFGSVKGAALVQRFGVPDVWIGTSRGVYRGAYPGIDALYDFIEEPGLTALGVSPDGSALLTGNDAGDVSFHYLGFDLSILDWSVRLGGDISHVVFSTDGTRAVTLGGSIRVWDIATAAQFVPPVGRYAAISDDGSQLLIATTTGVALWDVDNDVVLRTFAGMKEPMGFAGADTVVVSGSDDKLYVFDTQTGGELRTLDASGQYLDVSPDGSLIAVAAKVGPCCPGFAVRVLDFQTGAEVQVLGGLFEVLSDVAFSKDGSHLMARDVGVSLWDTATWTLDHEIRRMTAGLSTAAFSPDGSRCAMSHFAFPVVIYNLYPGHTLLTLPEETRSTSHLDYSPDGLTLLTCGYNVIHVWDANSGFLLQTINQKDVRAAAFLSDGNRIVASIRGGDVVVWDASTGAMTARLGGNAYLPAVVSRAQRGLELFVDAKGGVLNRWDLEAGELADALVLDDVEINSFAISPDARQALTRPGSLNGKAARLWELTPLTPLGLFTDPPFGVGQIAFAPQQGRIVTGGDQYVHFWNSENYSVVASLYSPIGRNFVQSPGGDLLLTYDRSEIWLWESPLPMGPPTLVAASLRKSHGFDQAYTKPIALAGPRSVEPRSASDATQLLAVFDQPVWRTDYSPLDCSNVTITGGVCESVQLDGRMLTIDVALEADAEVSVRFTGVRGQTADHPGEIRFATLEGDVNQDEAVNVLDLQAVKDALHKPVNGFYYRNDVNRDGLINISDLQRVKTRLLATVSAQ